MWVHVNTFVIALNPRRYLYQLAPKRPRAIIPSMQWCGVETSSITTDEQGTMFPQTTESIGSLKAGISRSYSGMIAP